MLGIAALAAVSGAAGIGPVLMGAAGVGGVMAAGAGIAGLWDPSLYTNIGKSAYRAAQSAGNLYNSVGLSGITGLSVMPALYGTDPETLMENANYAYDNSYMQAATANLGMAISQAPGKIFKEVVKGSFLIHTLPRIAQMAMGKNPAGPLTPIGLRSILWGGFGYFNRAVATVGGGMMGGPLGAIGGFFAGGKATGGILSSIGVSRSGARKWVEDIFNISPDSISQPQFSPLSRPDKIKLTREMKRKARPIDYKKLRQRPRVSQRNPYDRADTNMPNIGSGKPPHSSYASGKIVRPTPGLYQSSTVSPDLRTDKRIIGQPVRRYDTLHLPKGQGFGPKLGVPTWERPPEIVLPGRQRPGNSPSIIIPGKQISVNSPSIIIPGRSVGPAQEIIASGGLQGRGRSAAYLGYNSYQPWMHKFIPHHEYNQELKNLKKKVRQYNNAQSDLISDYNKVTGTFPFTLNRVPFKSIGWRMAGRAGNLLSTLAFGLPFRSIGDIFNLARAMDPKAMEKHIKKTTERLAAKEKKARVRFEKMQKSATKLQSGRPDAAFDSLTKAVRQKTTTPVLPKMTTEMIGAKALTIFSDIMKYRYVANMIKAPIKAAATQALETIKTTSTVVRSLGRMEFGSGRTLETQMGSTERGRAIMAMQNVGISARTYLGREATLLAGGM